MMHPDRELTQAVVQTIEPPHCNIHIHFSYDPDRLWHPDPMPITADDILSSVENFIGPEPDQAQEGVVILWTRTGSQPPQREVLTVVRTD